MKESTYKVTNVTKSHNFFGVCWYTYTQYRASVFKNFKIRKTQKPLKISNLDRVGDRNFQNTTKLKTFQNTKEKKIKEPV